jgi:photosystem II stability/assembly factor-like uncharacterized protein
MALAVMLLGGCKGSGEHLWVPTPPSSRYTAIEPLALHALSDTHVVVVGSLTTTTGAPEGLIVWTPDAGKRWHRVATEIHDLSNVTFTSVYFSDRVRGWVAGRRVTPEGVHRAVVFRTVDGGNHWSEVTLPASDQVLVQDVPIMTFESDQRGEVVVSYRDPKSDASTESIYHTNDGGKIWTIAAFSQPTKPRTDERLVSWLNKSKGNAFRLRRSERPGVTVLESTASGGKDWMTVSELSVSYIPSFY